MEEGVRTSDGECFFELDLELLRDPIIEAGVDLGLFFRNSGNLEDLILAQDALYSALMVSKYDYIEVKDIDTDVLSLLLEINSKIEKIKNE